MMMFKFHVPVKTERAVAVACSDWLGHSFMLRVPLCLLLRIQVRQLASASGGKGGN
jgi:hypothetical protein